MHSLDLLASLERLAETSHLGRLHSGTGSSPPCTYIQAVQCPGERCEAKAVVCRGPVCVAHAACISHGSASAYPQLYTASPPKAHYTVGDREGGTGCF